jgi:hypothetical protein
VEPNEHNLLLQEELADEKALSPYGLPTCLNFLCAKDYLTAKDRARGSSPLPDFTRVANVSAKLSSNDRIFATMKAALLAIEAALPVGCIDTRENGVWRPAFSKQWRLAVVKADGPATLTCCTIVLEDCLTDFWLKESVGHIRSCLPARWKAVAEASPSALALRIILLDRAIMYGSIDKKRFAKRIRR